MLQTIPGWVGDLPAYDGWVRSLWVQGEDRPSTIEFLLGSTNPQRYSEVVACAGYEIEDIAAKVGETLTRILNEMRDRMQVAITLRATSVDANGVDGVWVAAGKIERSFMRVTPMPAVAAVPSVRPPTVAPPRPSILPTPADVWGNDEPEEEDEPELVPVEERRNTMPPVQASTTRIGARLRQGSGNTRPGPRPVTVQHPAGGGGRMSALDVVVSTLRMENATVMAENRFMVEQLAWSFERTIEIMGDVMRTQAGEGERSRTSLEKMQASFVNAERERAKAERDTRIAEVQGRLDSEKRVGVVKAESTANLMRFMERVAKEKPVAAVREKSATDTAADRAVSMAEKVAEKIMLGGSMSGGGGGGGGGGEAAGGMAGMSPDDIFSMLAFLGPEQRTKFMRQFASKDPGLAKKFAGEVADALDAEVPGWDGPAEGEVEEEEESEGEDEGGEGEGDGDGGEA
jgi:hypothetical protein